MSVGIIAKLLGWSGLPQWALELIAVGVVALGIWVIHLHTLHTGIREGIARQVAADDAATAKLQAQVARDTAALQARAAAAETAYAQAQSNLNAYRLAHPIGPVVPSGGVCLDAAHDRGGRVPEGPAAEPGDAHPAPPAAVGQPVPARDSVSPEDRGRLLDAFAALFDDTDGHLRLWQAR